MITPPLNFSRSASGVILLSSHHRFLASGRQVTADMRCKPTMIVVITAGSVTPVPPSIFWLSGPRNGSKGASLPVLLIPSMMRPAVMTESVVVKLHPIQLVQFVYQHHAIPLGSLGSCAPILNDHAPRHAFILNHQLLC